MAHAKSNILKAQYESIESSEEYESAEEQALESQELLVSIASNASESSYASAQKEKWRNLVAYWFLGLTNNFAYVIMLSAAHDILSEDVSNITLSHSNSFQHLKSDATVTALLPSNSSNNPRDCNILSTGTVLLADIIPSLVVKMIAPFIPLIVHFRISLVVVLCTSSFIIVALAMSSSMALFGVIFASASAGIGETTFLAYSAYYHQDVVSTWSSGTGAAGLFGALSYAALTSLGLTPHQAIFFMLIVPIIMSLSFWQLLEHPPQMRFAAVFPRLASIFLGQNSLEDGSPSQLPLVGELVPPLPGAVDRLSFDEKLRLLPSLSKFMVPLTLVYLAEYLINQGLSELIYFPGNKSWISHDQQYRWYQVVYQIGVLISRSSVNLVYIHRIWLTSILQWLNVLLFLTGAIFWWFGTIWLVFALILWEGLLGGAAYVNTFYRLSKEVVPEQKEFAFQATSLSDTFGITIAGLISIPLHNAICEMPLL